MFLPFVMSYRESSEGKYYDAESATTWVDLTGNEEALAKADQERLAEDLRLLYVALTRAVYGCFIGIAPLRNGNSSQEPTSAHRSAMGFCCKMVKKVVSRICSKRCLSSVKLARCRAMPATEAFRTSVSATPIGRARADCP